MPPSNMPDIQAINEALRRAREMQSRSAPPAQREAEPQPEPLPEEPAKAAAEEKPPVSMPPAKPNSPLDLLLKDKERTLILALLILLSSEGGNTELLFALMYLLI